MMIPSEMPSVTMGENGHGNGNNLRMTAMMIIMLTSVLIMMAMIMMGQRKLELNVSTRDDNHL